MDITAAWIGGFNIRVGHSGMARKRNHRPHRRPPPVPKSGIVAFGLLVLLATLWLIGGGDGAVADGPNTATSRFSCSVAYVNDGDTLRCEDGTRVRLHAVAARETDETCSPGHPCPAASAVSAKATLERLVAGSTITCSRTGRSYDRVTAICWTPAEVEVNCAMIESGTAVVWERFDRIAPICRTS